MKTSHGILRKIWTITIVAGILLISCSFGSCEKTEPKATPNNSQPTATPDATPNNSQPTAVPGGIDQMKATTPSERTIVTANLAQEIASGKNIVWCATLQMAWNELLAAAGNSIGFEKEPPLAAILKSQSAIETNVDKTSYITAAGIVGEALFAKMTEQASSPLASQALSDIRALPKDSLVAYAYLLKTLPFAWAFTRFDTPLQYASTDVASFGINQYMSKNENDQKLAKQVQILDYASNDDFVLELTTTSASDRLILAKIAPNPVLQETIATVLRRIEKRAPTSMQSLESLVIPVIDFDLLQNYPELCGQPITTKTPELNGKQFSMVAQQTRFKLDETGAVLASKVLAVSAVAPREFIFDKPFLLMLLQKNAKTPYLALWIDNPDLLLPFE